MQDHVAKQQILM